MSFRPLVSLFVFASLAVSGFAQGWFCIGGNAQHTGSFLGASQTAALINWQTPLQDSTTFYGTGNGEHLAAPMVTPGNTVVYGYEFSTTSNGQNNYDNWRIMARNAVTGNLVWQMNTDYSATIVSPNGWTTTYPMSLFILNPLFMPRGVAFAGGGGSIFIRYSADATVQPTPRIVFYTTLADFTANQAAYAPVKVDTPITSDSFGNLYFGYKVTGSVPANLANLGTGGIVKVNALTGATSYTSIQSMGIDSNLSYPGLMCAPALTPDGNFIYVGLTGGDSYLAKLSTSTLAVVASVRIIDPAVTGQDAYIIDASSACPMVAPDGHVFLGVFGNQYRESHGWMMQYDANLSQTDANGNTFPVGAFGWDSLISVVPSNIVPSYAGAAKYLVLTKYNNYDEVDFGNGDAGADGMNKVAVLDPTSNSITRDRQSGIPVMNEVITVVGLTKTGNDSSHPNSVDEWCINSAAVDIPRKSAILNSEDGHMYRWNFVTNSLTEVVDLGPAVGEPYTETALGPDGQSYIMNNCILYAVGSNKATGYAVQQGTVLSGQLADLWTVDGMDLSVKSATAAKKAGGTTNGQSLAVQTNFTVPVSSSNPLNIVAYISGAVGQTATISAYNNSTKAYDSLGPITLTAGQNVLRASTVTTTSNYIGATGTVQILIQVANASATSAFTTSFDFVTCGASTQPSPLKH